MNKREIEDAIQGAFDGTLDEDACCELREILKTDHTARTLYFQQASLHQLLTYRFSRSQPLETARTLSATRLRLQTRRNVRWALASAAALMLGLGLTLGLLLTREPTPLATFEVDAGSRFSVEQQASKLPSPPSNELRQGARVRLDQGSLEVRISKGTRAVLLAPATFRIDSKNRMQLENGTAWFEVGKDARGFQVATPQMIITDLGTQFGVMAHADASHEIHVFSGRVIARGLSALRTEESLTTGMARLCDPVGRLKAVSLRPEAFLTRLPAHSESGLIINGDFETGNPPPARTYGTPATASLLPGWLFGPDITVVHATSEGRPGYGEREVTILSSTADVQVGFNSDTDSRPDPEDVTLRQTFITRPGMTYAVRFEMGAIIFDPATMEVTATVFNGIPPEIPGAKTALARHVESRAPEAGNGYNPPASFTFTATSDTTTLIFTETSARSLSADPVIDNVSVRPID
jgi:ferric-dicitrate binding protein FerR (iron transport regulator)